jgi:Flp pilus assembly protein TadG
MIRIRNERGSVAVEFGLIAPIFFLLLFGIIDFGRAFYTVHDLAAAVREGARYAAVLDDPVGRADEVRTVVKNFALSFGGSPVTDAQIEVDFDGASVVVRIRDYPFDFIVLPIGDVNMTRQATLRWERAAVS